MTAGRPWRLRETAGVALVGAVALLAILAPVAAPFDPLAMQPALGSRPPSLAHPLGTDFFGRDVLSRIMWGAHPSLLIAGLSVGLGGLVGSAAGLVAGYARGAIDAVLMRPMDVLLSFPIIILALAIVAALGSSLPTLVATVALLFVPRFARIVRAETLALREVAYVEAARAAGERPLAILVGHILPNVLSPIVVAGSVFLADAILIEAGLSFLGVGVAPPAPSWGNMLADGRTNMLGAPWLTVFPGLVLTLTLIGFNLLGDVLRDRLDPRLRGPEP